MTPKSQWGGTFVIRWQRCMRIQLGRMAAALEWAQRVTKCIRDHRSEWEQIGGIRLDQLRLFVSRLGVGHSIYWFADFVSLNELDYWQKTMLSWKDYQALLGGIANLFVEGSLVDTVMDEVKYEPTS